MEKSSSASAPALISSDDGQASERNLSRGFQRPRSASVTPTPNDHWKNAPYLRRRGSHDEIGFAWQTFRVIVDRTKSSLLLREDTNHDSQITVDDSGPMVFRLATARSDGVRKSEVRGTYPLANLLQELVIAEDRGRLIVKIDERNLYESPVDRLGRRIKDMFWPTLVRRLDLSLIGVAARDPKDRTENPSSRIYVPFQKLEQYRYYQRIAQEHPKLKLDVQRLPEGSITPEFVETLNHKPGILALDMQKCGINAELGKDDLRGAEFVVPGGRFNEFYGWDSYFCAVGLLETGRTSLVQQIIRNYIFEIEHYGKILNANRSYYLCRSQPPFLTDLSIQIFKLTRHESNSRELFRLSLLAAMKEYHEVWMANPRYDPKSGLSRYGPPGVGIPPEVEESHFDHIILPYATKYGTKKADFIELYNKGKLKEPLLDDFLRHDRAVRESGHDTSYRLENVAADLATIDLNALLYKYEKDISWAIRTVFDDALEVPVAFATQGRVAPYLETSSTWDRRARKRKILIDKYLWNQERGTYLDYNTASETQTTCQSATAFYALWSGVSSPRQAADLVAKALPRLENAGGLSSTSKESIISSIGPNNPPKQWDYPFGWAPHQMLAWGGLRRYGFEEEAQRLAYRWLHMITKVAVEYNGAVVEKYNVIQLENSHRVEAEYGNQGLGFKGLAREGFGWTNASYSYGLTFLNTHMKRTLSLGAPYETFAGAIGIR